MGIFSDVMVPIEELLQPVEDLQQSLLLDQLAPILDAVTAELVDLNIRALHSLLVRREI